MHAVRNTLFAVLAVVVALPAALLAQEDPEKKDDGSYGGTPDTLRPYRGVGEPARRFFVDPPSFRGPGRDDPPPEGLESVAIGLIAPVHGTDAVAGRAMRNAAQLALDEANANGGFGDAKLPFALHVREEGATWGAAGDAAVDLVYEEGAWGLLGGYEDTNSHVLTRVLLKVEVPNLNPTGVDPTITEHNIPWLLRVRPDDRQTSYRLAKRVFEKDGRKRVVMFRANSRYGRTGTGEFKDAARRLHKPVLLETRYVTGDDDWSSRMERIKLVKPDAIVVWGRAGPTGAAVRALRDAGIDCALYGPDRIVAPEFLKEAGDAAEGFVFTYPMDPRSRADAWVRFRDRYRERFGEEADATASYTYDATRLLVDAIRKAGLNRARIRDALYEVRTYDGVSGTIRFDPTQNNITPVILGHVEKGRFVFDG
jgi:branched-chain amino acid transport system substrate-binding protein